MDRFFIPELPPSGHPIRLDEGESGHIVRVRRMREGEGVELSDGNGWVVEAVIAEAHPKRTRLTEVSRRFEEPGPEAGVTLAVGLIKTADRLEFLLEKATEIGVGRILLFEADRSERSTVREDRCRGHILAAMKQSKRAWLPAFGLLKGTEAVIGATDGLKRIVAHEKTRTDAEFGPGSGPCALFIGPEGGFSDREVGLFTAAGAAFVSLGQARLRAETAALVMLARSRTR